MKNFSLSTSISGKCLNKLGKARYKAFMVSSNYEFDPAKTQNESIVDALDPYAYHLVAKSSEGDFIGGVRLNFWNELGEEFLDSELLQYLKYKKMGVSLPEKIQSLSKELETIEFTKLATDSPFVVAVQAALDLGVKKILLIGFDGYNIDLNENQFILAQENQNVINDIIKNKDISVTTLSPTKYENIKLTSIYSLIQ